MNIFKKIWAKIKGESTSSPNPKPITSTEYQKMVEGKIDTIVAERLADCENLTKLNKSLRHWQSVFKAMAYAESGFKPIERYVEPPSLGKDVITGRQNTSEGLFQMSYQDSKYHGCKFDWNQDKNKSDNDPTKTIFDIRNNTECAMDVLDFLVKKHGSYIFNSGHYWAVLKPSNKRHGVFLSRYESYMKKVEAEKMEEVKNPWFEIANGELNTKEVSGNSDNPKIVEYHSVTTLKATDDETPWCSSFVSWCLEKSGYKSTKNAWARSYLNYGEKLTDPVEGCIVVFSRGSSSGHVAFFVEDKGSSIKVLGGNQGNQVCFAEYPKSRLLGYRLPTEKI